MVNLIFCLMGPTASGKTALAAQLVKKHPFELISVDSAMIYRDMNIGTAKPTPQELQHTPHHLIDIRDPIETYCAAQFCADALSLSQAIIKNNKIPLLVGGTMMYFNALQKGLSCLPKAHAGVRQQLEEEASLYGWNPLHQRLMEVDFPAASRIHPHDTQRIQRALEVYYVTGKTLTALLNQQKQNSDYFFVNLILFPQRRSWLHERITQRFDHMLSQGLVEEVRQLQQKWSLTRTMPAMRCVGYRQIFEHFLGHYDYGIMRDKGIVATRQLAKRQLTWLRTWDNAEYYEPENPTFHAEVMAKINEILGSVNQFFGIPSLTVI